MESRVIEQLVWQWWVENSGEWLVASGERRQQGSGPSTAPARGGQAQGNQVALPTSGQASGERRQQGSGPSAALTTSKWPFLRQGERVTLPTSGQASGEQAEARQQQVPHHHPARPAGWVRDDSHAHEGTPRIIARAAGKPWSRVRVARLLGVSHTWVNKLVKRFEADPERMRRKMAAFAPASLEKLERAREETRHEREMGRVRGPIRWRRVKVKIQGKEMRMATPTRAEMVRRGMKGVGLRLRPPRRASSGQTSDPSCVRASERPFLRQGKRVASRQMQMLEDEQGVVRVPYREVPEWARGLASFGGAGMAAGPGAGVRTGVRPPAATRTPKPVRFAFRRRKR